MTVCKIRKYNGAHILILNEWQSFIYCVYYKGQFNAYQFQIDKRGEYTTKEYIQALDATLLAAKATVDQIKNQRSLTTKLKHIYVTVTKRLSPRQ